MTMTWIVDAGDFPQGAGGVAHFGAEAELGDAADVRVLVHAHLPTHERDDKTSVTPHSGAVGQYVHVHTNLVGNFAMSHDVSGCYCIVKLRV